MLYSEASSPWRHLGKVRAIVCFVFSFLVLSGTVLHMGGYGTRAAGVEGPFLGVFFSSRKMNWLL